MAETTESVASSQAEVSTPVNEEAQMPFGTFGEAVTKQFNAMAKLPLFRVQIEKELLWQMYLSSFPKGTDPIYRTRTEHDCQACRHFIRTVGGVVAIVDGQLQSIWDVQVGGRYQPVANAMAELVKVCPIDNIFLHTESIVGIAKNFQQVTPEAPILTWEHFAVKLPREYVKLGVDIGPLTSLARGTKDVMLRSLQEISLESTGVVLDLIAQNSLLRGEEHGFAVSAFRELKLQFMKLNTPAEQDMFCWQRIKSPESVSHIRNTAIGTLLTSLTDGKDMDAAVRSFETLVGPANYKRPTAVITTGMIEKARQTIEELGFTSALERRYAHLEDITINNILYADRTVKKTLGGNVFDELASNVLEKVQDFDKVEEVPIEKFLTDILPKAESIEVMFENRHASNLVSLVAPVDPQAKGMFKWPNNFSWSYTGDVADSIKERVKRAGGNVTGDLRCSLSWFNHDDLDLHMTEPDGTEIYYNNKRPPRSTGRLDVDMNAGYGSTRTPVENITYPSRSRMKEGTYKLSVHQFQRRETVDIGFDAELEFDGVVHRFSYGKMVKQGDSITVADFDYTHKDGVKVTKSLPSSQASKKVWGVPTQTFHKVNVLMMSPNHWDNHPVGNKHYFFMLDGCLNEGQARGFFNEFLSQELDTHRKVLEVVGSKMKTEESDRQLSGLGFSSTQRASILCRVKGSFNRVVKITF